MNRRELLKTAGGTLAASLLPAEFAWAQSKAAISPMMTTLSTYMAEAAHRPLPDAVIEKTKHMILDTLAAAISGAGVLRPSFGHIGMMASPTAPHAVWRPIGGWLRAQF